MLGSIVAAPLLTQAAETKQAAQETTQISFDDVAYQALEDAARSAVEKAKQELEAAEKRLAEAKAAEDQGVLAALAAADKIAIQQTALATVEQQVIDAAAKLKAEKEKLEKVQKQHADTITMAEAELESFEKKIDEKRQPYLEAQKVADEKEVIVNQKGEEYANVKSEQDAIINKANAKIAEAEALYQGTQQAFNQSETAIQEANLNLEDVINKINKQPEIIAVATEKKIAAQHAVEDAQIRSGEAIANYPVADAAAKSAQATYEAVRARETAMLPTIESELAYFEAALAQVRGELATLSPSDPAYAAKETEMNSYLAGQQYSQNEKAMLSNETAGALSAYNNAQGIADAALAEISAAETAYQETLVNKKAVDQAADAEIAAAEAMQANRDNLITKAETAVQNANLNQEEKLKEMNQAQANRDKVTAEQNQVIKGAEEVIAKSLDELTKAETAFQEANLEAEAKKKEYDAVVAEQQPFIDFSNETIKEANEELQAQKDKVAEAEKALADAKAEVDKLKADIAAAKDALKKAQDDIKASIEAAKKDITAKEAAKKAAEERLAGLQAGKSDAKSGRPKTINLNGSTHYQQGYEEAYALLTMSTNPATPVQPADDTGKVDAKVNVNVRVFLPTVRKSVYIKEYRRVFTKKGDELPKTGEAANWMIVLVGLCFVSLSSAILLKKKYSI